MTSIAELTAKAPVNRGAKDPRGPDGKVIPGVVWMIQEGLRASGAELVMDGDFGRGTEAAVIRFKAAHGYAATGNVGPLTGALLDAEIARAASAPPPAPLPSVAGTADWLLVCRAMTGTKEFPGGADNPIILNMASYVGERYPDLAAYMRGYTHDEIPFCGLGQAFCMAKTGHRPPKESLYATNWFYKWDNGVKLKEPALGAIMVKTRNGGGHVSEYEGEDEGNWFCRGFNQSDTVNVARFPKATTNVLGWMWPADAPRPTGGRVHTTFANAVAVREQ